MNLKALILLILLSITVATALLANKYCSTNLKNQGVTAKLDA